VNRSIRLKVFAVLAVLGVNACSKNSVLEPQSPAATDLQLRYSARFGNQEGGYTVRYLEFADETGAVREVRNPQPVWSHTLTLKQGDRVYLRVEVEFESVMWTALQVMAAGQESYYRIASCERADGPGTCVLVIDEVVP